MFLQESYGQVQPKLGSAIPPYNSHYDRHAKSYFKNKGLTMTLRKTDQVFGGRVIMKLTLTRYDVMLDSILAVQLKRYL